MLRAGVIAAAAALVLAGCAEGEPPPLRGTELAAAITPEALGEHIDSLQRIADANGGNRGDGMPGFTASVDYVAGKLRERGFEVTTPEFGYDIYEVRSQRLTVAGQEVPLGVVRYSPATAASGVTARIVALPDTDGPGCETTDYEGRTVAGAVVLVPRGVCPFAQKARIAAEQGAAAAIVANNEEGPLPGATLGEPEAGRIPTVVVDRPTGAVLAAATEPVTLVVDAANQTITSRNVIAQTRTGSTDDVVMVGAHLDSVPEGPGLNDNGSGTAAVLETAVQLGGSPQVTNSVRFAFWGAEELGLVGSDRYLSDLDREQRLDIALYLNFDMLGSPNYGHFVYDGDNSDRTGEPAGPDGSAGIERTMAAALLQRGVTPRGSDLDGRSDYQPFAERAIPVGGSDTGADAKKTAEEAALWGGTVDQTFDPNYHTARDTAANVNRDALAAEAGGVALTVATYAGSIGGPNGVPARADRERVRGDKA